MKHADSSNTPLNLGNIVLIDNGKNIGFDGAVEAVFVYNLYYKQYGFSITDSLFLPYEAMKFHEVSFYKVSE